MLSNTPAKKARVGAQRAIHVAPFSVSVNAWPSPSDGFCTKLRLSEFHHGADVSIRENVEITAARSTSDKLNASRTDAQPLPHSKSSASEAFLVNASLDDLMRPDGEMTIASSQIGHIVGVAITEREARPKSLLGDSSDTTQVSVTIPPAARGKRPTLTVSGSSRFDTLLHAHVTGGDTATRTRGPGCGETEQNTDTTSVMAGQWSSVKPSTAGGSASEIVILERRCTMRDPSRVYSSVAAVDTNDKTNRRGDDGINDA